MTDERETPDERPDTDLDARGDAAERPRVTAPPRAFDEAEAEAEAEPEAEAEGTPPPPSPSMGEGAGTEASLPPSSSMGEGVGAVAAPFEDLSELPGLLEALLFVADHPVDTSYLARAVEVSVTRVEGALDALAESLRESQRGIRLQRGPQGAQLVSAPEASAQVERFLGLEANRRLSTAALETLAIVAYRQPITRGQVDAVRGVSSDGAIATLRSRDLIEAAGHAPGPGRPMLFRTTQRFLEHFGLERPGQLPALPDDIDLPPAEIGAQLGLDEAAVIEALAAPPVEVTPEPEDIAAEPPEASEETEDDIAEAIAAVHGPDVEIPSDVRALTVAAEHAFEASRDRLADEPDSARPSTGSG